MNYQITTQSRLRKQFWIEHPELEKKRYVAQNSYPTDTRIAWCDYIDAMARGGVISEELASRATL